MISLQALTLEALRRYIESTDYQQSAVLPIAYQRAVSHLQNPYAQPSDVVLLLAKTAPDETVGYLGIVPDYWQGVAGQAQKFGWLSCLWVSPKARGQALGSRLLQAAATYYDNKLLSADYVPATKIVYDKAGIFHSLPFQKSGLRLHWRANLQQILPPKHKVFGSLRPALWLTDTLLNIAQQVRHIGKNTHLPKGVSWRYVRSIDDATDACLQAWSHAQQLPYARNVIDWQMTYPWLSEAPDKDAHQQRYYFSTVAQAFSVQGVQVFDAQQQLIAFFVLFRRDNALKLPFFYAAPAGVPLVAQLLAHWCKRWRITTLTVFHPPLVAYWQQQAPAALAVRALQRYYLATPAVAQWLTDLNVQLQDGDGDCGFT